MKIFLSALVFAALAVPAISSLTGSVASQEEAVTDHDAVRQAGLNYVEALYEVKPDLIERSVHPELRKYGFHRTSPDQDYRQFPMTFEQLVELAGRWNKDGEQANESSLKRVEVLDVMDATAAIKVHAAWGVDHMQLGKFEGKWKIINILWQSHPME